MAAAFRIDQRAKAQHIDREICAAQAYAEAIRHQQIPVRFQDLAQLFERLPQAAAGQRLGRRIPQQRGHLFAVGPKIGAEKKQAQQAAGLAGAKGDLLTCRQSDRPTVSKKVDLKSRHSCSLRKHVLRSNCTLVNKYSTTKRRKSFPRARLHVIAVGAGPQAGRLSTMPGRGPRSPHQRLCTTRQRCASG